MNFWDILLLITVPVMGTLTAYIRAPHYKALVLCFPIPFTLAVLSLGEHVNATHAFGMIVLLGFWLFVYYLRCIVKLPILAVIVLSAVAYCAASIGLARIIPRTESSFWIAELSVVAVAVFLWRRMSPRVEPEHESALPVWIKFTVMFAVVLGLIAIKSLLSGFMTVFPMVGVLTAYETRHSLWTTCRQIPAAMISLAAMMATMRLVTPHFGVGLGIVAGWVVLGLVLVGLMRGKNKRSAMKDDIESH